MSVQVIDTLKPKNGLDFPVVEAIDVAVEGYDSLADAVTHFATDAMIDTIIATLATKASASDLAITNAAVESKADKTTTDSLQSQIDQIAQATGTGSADTEVAQARVDAEGVSHETLEERLNSEYNKQAESIAQLQNATFETEPIPLSFMTAFDGKYINSTTGKLGTDAGNSGYRLICKPLTIYVLESATTVSGTIGIGSTASTTLNDNTVFSKWQKAVNSNRVTLVTSADAQTLYFYSATSEISKLTLYELESNIVRLGKKTEGIEKFLDSFSEDISAFEKHTLNTHYIKDNGTVGGDQACSGFWISCEPNTKYTIKRSLANDVMGFGCIDDIDNFLWNGQPLTTFKKSTTATELTLITDSDSGNIFVYALSSEIGAIELTEQVNLINTFEVMMPMESGMLPNGRTSDTVAAHLGGKRTAYPVKVNDAKYFTLDTYNSEWESILVSFYDSSFERLSYAEITSQAQLKKGVAIPTTCTYIKFVAVNSNMEKAKYTFFYAAAEPIIVKNPSQRADTEWLTLDVTDDMFTCARLLLPPNYKVQGEKVPLILWMDGSGNFTRWTSDFSSVKKPYLLYLRDEGFAVLSIMGWGNNYLDKYPNCGMAHPYVTPTNLACLKAGVEWICDRYNIDYNNIHIMSKSQGGQVATYLASHPIFPIKSIGMFSPVVDFLSMPMRPEYADTRAAIAEDAGMTGDTSFFGSADFYFYYNSPRAVSFYQENINQLCGLNEAWTSLVGSTAASNFESAVNDCRKFWDEEYWTDTTKTDIYTNTDYIKIAQVPVTIWSAKDDDNTPYLAMVELVEQLKNGGTEAHMVTYPNGTGGHSSPDVGSNRIAHVTTALGIEYENVPSGWVENVAWIRSKMPK